MGYKNLMLTSLFCLAISFSFSQREGQFVTKTSYLKDGKMKKSAINGSSHITKRNDSLHIENSSWIIDKDTLNIEIIHSKNFTKGLKNFYKIAVICSDFGGLNSYAGHFADGPIVYDNSPNEEVIWKGKTLKLKYWVISFLYLDRDQVKGGWRISLDASFDDGKTWVDFMTTEYWPIKSK